MERYDERRVVVIGGAAAAHFTADGDAFQAGFPYLLYVGNQKPHKNLSRLIQAYAVPANVTRSSL